jgi:diguanylate cyclase (GGDEF)-like protein/PAS domain S-box-containing protein
VSVLVVDDEPGIRRLVRDQLQDIGMEVAVASTIAEADAAIALHTYEVVILDLTLPDGSGLDVLDRLHRSGSTSHVIVLSGSTSEADRVDALRRGADDFVVKPFYVRELTARVLAVRRRRDPVADATLRFGRYRIDLQARQVTSAGELVELTTMEFDLLAYLAVRPGHVFDRNHLLHAVWRSAPDWQQAATVTEHIRRLRRKLEVDPAHPTLLTTVRGAGYRFDPPADTGQPSSADQPPPLRPGTLVHVDGVVVFCDAASADILGAPDPTAIVGQRLTDLLAATALPATRDRFTRSDTGPIGRSELVELRQGADRHVTAAVESSAADWHGQPARRLHLTPIADSPARLRRLAVGILAEVTDAVVITDLHFHIRSWNSAAERLYGWSEHEVWGRHILDVLQWIGDTAQLPEIWERLEHTGRWHGAGTQVARDGSVIEILGSTTLLRDDTGEAVGVVAVNRPAVEHVRAAVEPGAEGTTTSAGRLAQALDDDEFDVLYQPVVSLADGHLITLEALVRWEHPDLGTLPPSEFLDGAERSGLIVELGQLVLDRACRQAAAWRSAGADVHLSVNVSTRQLADPAMVERFTTTICGSGLDPAFLWLEITETALVEEVEKAGRALRALVDLGVGVAIDDFGTGWASLTYLRSFPVHALKIDGSFISGAGCNAQDTAIIRSIVSLGAELDLFVIAEGIETEVQRAAVRELGCAFGQGFLFGRPTTADEVPIDRARRIDASASPTGGSDVPTAEEIVAAAARPTREDGGVATLEARAWPRRARPVPKPLGSVPTPRNEEVESDLVANLLRGLLRVRSAPAAVHLLELTIRGMGGVVVPASAAGPEALPVDVSLGEGPPMLVEADRFTVARMQIERLLPRLVEDARQAVDLLRQTERLAEATARDELTGLANRRVFDRVLPRAVAGSVVMIDLDHFKAVNDEFGHAAGDAVLTAFAKVLTEQGRAQDTTCRIGGEEFALVLTDADVAGAQELVGRIRAAWRSAAPRAVTFSAGVAQITDHGGTAALLDADRALYAAKALGRNRTETAPAPDDGGGA